MNNLKWEKGRQTRSLIFSMIVLQQSCKPCLFCFAQSGRFFLFFCFYSCCFPFLAFKVNGTEYFSSFPYALPHEPVGKNQRNLIEVAVRARLFSRHNNKGSGLEIREENVIDQRKKLETLPEIKST